LWPQCASYNAIQQNVIPGGADPPMGHLGLISPSSSINSKISDLAWHDGCKAKLELILL